MRVAPGEAYQGDETFAMLESGWRTDSYLDRGRLQDRHKLKQPFDKLCLGAVKGNHVDGRSVVTDGTPFPGQFAAGLTGRTGPLLPLLDRHAESRIFNEFPHKADKRLRFDVVDDPAGWEQSAQVRWNLIDTPGLGKVRFQAGPAAHRTQARGNGCPASPMPGVALVQSAGFSSAGRSRHDDEIQHGIPFCYEGSAGRLAMQQMCQPAS